MHTEIQALRSENLALLGRLKDVGGQFQQMATENISLKCELQGMRSSLAAATQVPFLCMNMIRLALWCSWHQVQCLRVACYLSLAMVSCGVVGWGFVVKASGCWVWVLGQVILYAQALIHCRQTIHL